MPATETTLGWGAAHRTARFGAAALRLMKQNPAMVLPLSIIIAVALLAVFAPLVAPHDPIDGSLSHRLLPPSWAEGGNPDYVLGTDTQGRDVFSRLVYGARVSLSISLLAMLVALVIGCVIGITSGYYGGTLDIVLMRLVDIFLSLPMILIAVMLAVVLGSSFLIVIIILGLLTWPRWARQIRSETLVIKQRDFVSLAKVAGCSPRVIMRRHLFPNVVPTLLVLASLEFGHLVITESALSFLGVGVPPPTPSWGNMVAESRGLLATAWWLPMLPGFLILACVLSFNLIGDWVRDKLDPKLRQV